MLSRLIAVSSSFVLLSVAGPNVAFADDVGRIIGGAITGVAIATGAVVPYERRESLRTYVVRERPRSYVYDDDLTVGREFRYGPHGTQEVPREYGVPGHHYAVVNNRAVIFHPHTRRIVHVYDPYDD